MNYQSTRGLNKNSRLFGASSFRLWLPDVICRIASGERPIHHVDDKATATAAEELERSNSEGSVLDFINETVLSSTVYRSQLDDICLFVQKKLNVIELVSPMK